MKKRHSRYEVGQALILVALAMPLFMSIAALVVDGTNLMVHRRQLQTASDGAALAASQELGPYLAASPGTLTCDPSWSTQMSVQPRPKLVSVIQDYSSRNDGPATLNGGSCASDPTRCSAATDTNCYTWPYKGSTGLVEVRLRESVGGFITRAVDALLPGNPLGNAFNVSARAVASAAAVTNVIPGSSSTSTTPGLTVPGTNSVSSSTSSTPGRAIAIFAFTHCGTTTGPGQWTLNAGSCDPCGTTHPAGISITGNPQTSVDAVLSNGSVNLGQSGSANKFQGTLGWAGFGPPPENCTVNSVNVAGGSVTTKQQQSDVQMWPEVYNRPTLCSGHDNVGPVTLNTADIPQDGTTPLVVCSQTSIDVESGLSSGRTYKITLVAPLVTLSTSLSNFILAPASTNPRFPTIWQYGQNQDFVFNHNNSSVNGTIWIENGNLTYIGNSGATGFYEAQNVLITGNSYVMTGSGPTSGGTTSTTFSTTTIPGTTIGPSTTTVITPPSTQTIGTTIGLNE